MKTISIILTITLLVACSGEPGQIKEQKPAVTVQTIKKKPKPEFPRFDTVVEMLKSAGDYRMKDGNLKILSSEGEPLHLQVSKWVFEGDTEKTIKRQVKRNVVYVAFQAFAKSDINKLTITSVPLLMEDIETKDKYLTKYKKTVTVDRKSAKQVLKKYLDLTSFQNLYKLHSSGQFWLPNDNFAKLKFDKLNSVYSELAK